MRCTRATVSATITIATFSLLCLGSSTAGAEAGSIRMARGLSLGFLPSIVMEDGHLIEKHARAAGLGELKVEWQAFIGGVAMNDALLAGQVDFASGGPPPFALLWDRTRGSPLAVKGVAAINSSPMYLLTRNPAVNKIEDFGPTDRIAVPGAKISNQAVVLQMAAEKALGNPNKLDPLTVTLSLPEGFAALLSGNEVNSQFSGPPFQYQTADLEKSNVHKVLDSETILGGPTTFLLMWTTTRFHDANPTIYKAVYAALREAIDTINRDHRAVAETFLRVTKQKTSLEEVLRILDLAESRYSLRPQNMTKYVEFLNRTGVIKSRPASWKDMFFPEIAAELEGS